MEAGVEQREIGNNWAEFLGAMAALSGETKEGMAAAIGVSAVTMNRWLGGDGIQRRYQERLATVLFLEPGEIEHLHQGTESAKSQLAKSSGGEEAIEPSGLAEIVDKTEQQKPIDQVIGAFVTRIERGEPPLSETEAKLLQTLLGLDAPRGFISAPASDRPKSTERA